MTRILLIEDNRDLAFGLQNNLEIEGHEVQIAADGKSGINRIRDWQPDLIVLDLMLPEMDGFHVLRTIRGEGVEIPVLILTARGEEADKVRGLRLGANDYVTKPFGLLELLARVEVLLRPVSGPAVPAACEQFGDVEVRPSQRAVLRRGAPVELAPKEFDLLMALLRRGGDVVPREQLLRDVWGYASSVVTRTIDTHVAELRRKLEDDPASPKHILTVRKSGYRLQR